MKNHKGFAALEGLLIFVIIAILGFTGWYVYSARNKTNQTLDNANAANNSTVKYSKSSKATPSGESKVSLDKTYEGDLSYGNDKHKISVKYPSSWVVKNDGGAVVVTDNKGSETFIFGGRGFEETDLKSNDTEFTVDGTAFIDSIVTHPDGSLVNHTIRFKDTESKEIKLAKDQLMGLPVFRTVDYPSGQGESYREVLARIYLSFTVES
jgi:hypothetical protein